jgi:putative spermidine/putrescine transport system permease protein
MRPSGGLPYLVPMLVLSLGFFVAPLGLLTVYSFTGGRDAGLFANYAEFLGDPFSVAVVLDTILLGFKVVAGTTILGLPIALLYWHSGPRMRHLIVFLTLLPMLTSNVVRTFAWIVILGRQGPVSQGLMALGLTSTPTTLLFTEPGLVIALCQIDLPLLLLPLIAVLSRTDRRLVDAAETAGAGPWRVLFTVLLPLAVPGILAGWTLVFASTSASFVTQAVIGGARHIYLPQFVYRQVGVLFEWPLAAAVAFILLLSTGVVLLGLTMIARHRRFVGHA